MTSIYSTAQAFAGPFVFLLLLAVPMLDGYASSPGSSTTTLTSSLNPSTVGQPVTLTATVTSPSGTPKGKVTFKDGGATLESAMLSGGVAAISKTTLGIGTHSITAVYDGSAAFLGSTSRVLAQVVDKPASTVSLVSSHNPSAFGQAVTLTAKVSSGSGTPMGIVTFNNGSAWIGAAKLKGGVATLTTSSLTTGTLEISAVYNGAANLSVSTSAPLSQVINPAASTVTLVSSLNPSTIGQQVDFTATVAPEFSGTPAGEVVFKNGSVLLGSLALSDGMATLTTSSLPSGALTIAANYLPTAGFSASSGMLTQTVNQAGPPNYTLTAAALSPGSVTSGGIATSTIAVTPANGYSGSVNLSCTVTGNTPAPPCAFSTSSVTVSGTVSASSILTVSTSTSTPAGTYTVSIAGSDANRMAPSNGSQTLTLTVAAVIQHVVIIFQENRTPDNLFHDPVLISRGADLASSGVNSLGQTIPLSPIDLGTMGANPSNYDLKHSHEAFVSMYDAGKMDGADLIECSPAANCPPNANPNPQFRFVAASDVQPYYALAEQYTFGDRMFQTNEGSSYPAHQFILSGTSAPTAISADFAAESLHGIVGCIAAVATRVTMIDAAGSETAVSPEYPCFEHPTLTDLLDAQGVTWRYYTPTADTIWTAPTSIQHTCQEEIIRGKFTCTGPEWSSNVIVPQTRMLTDIANGQLPQVSWVIPDGLQSDHALANNGTGPSWVASVVNAIGTSPYWATTAIIITWDDWGGWYDHVAPKVIDDGVSWGSGYVYGFRVPLIVVSPYAKAAYISHVTHDFGSILKFVETNFDLPTLGYADEPADDLADCFDLTQTPLTFESIAAPLGAAEFINNTRPATPPDDD